MAVQEFNTPALKQVTVARVADPGVKPVNPLSLRQFMGNLAKDLNGLTGANVAAIADNYQLTRDGSVATGFFVQRLDPSGAHKDVRLPDPTGLGQKMFLIVNSADAAENLVVKTWDEGSTVGTVNQDEAGLFAIDDAGAWALIFVIAISLT